MILCECFADSRVEIGGLRRLFRIHWQFRARLDLEEAEARKALAKCGERSKGRHTGAQISEPVSCRERDFALQAEDRTAAHALEQHSLIPEDQISNTANPTIVIALKKTVGGSEFELIPYAEASLVNKFTIYTARPLRIHRRCQNPFW